MSPGAWPEPDQHHYWWMSKLPAAEINAESPIMLHPWEDQHAHSAANGVQWTPLLEDTATSLNSDRHILQGLHLMFSSTNRITVWLIKWHKVSYNIILNQGTHLAAKECGRVHLTFYELERPAAVANRGWWFSRILKQMHLDDVPSRKNVSLVWKPWNGNMIVLLIKVPWLTSGAHASHPPRLCGLRDPYLQTGDVKTSLKDTVKVLMSHRLWGLPGHWAPHTKTLTTSRQWALSPPFRCLLAIPLPIFYGK